MTKFLDTKGLERVISKLKTLIAGKADKSHTHTKSQISDFPKSLPASDVAAWAKAATKPGYSWGEISGKPSTFAPSSHTHSYIVPEGDNRSVATTPNSYKNKLSFAGIKYSNKIGSPTTSDYVYLVGLRGWPDSSGGNSHEIAFYEGGISHRDGASTAWGGWKQFIDSGNIGSQSVKYATTAGTANAVAWGNVTGKPSTFAPSSHTHSQYLTSHQSLANYYTKTDADSKFQAKGSYAAASHTHSQYLTSHQSLANYYTKTDADSKFQAKGSYAAASHTHSQYLTSHQSLANYYTKTDCDSKFQPKGSYAAASHTHMDTLIFDFSSNSSQTQRFPVGALKRDVRIICGGSPSGAPSLNVSSLAATLANGYYVEVINQISNKDVTFSMPHMVLQGTNWIKGTTKYIMPGRLYRFICCNGMMWDLNTNVR